MNQHGLGWSHFRRIRRQTRLLMGIIIAVVTLVTVLIFVSGYVFGSTRTTYYSLMPGVWRGEVGVQVVDGVPVTTPTVEAK